MMTREWLYTAVTRATRQVVLVGPRANLLGAVARRESRVTGFPLELARIRRGAT
jgi:exodeoxyribonuclease V alpha subunit